MDNELLLYDRIQVIQATNQKYDLENNAYLSFSGGKDSTILHYLLDMALPNNRIPRVFIDTGIEYQMIRDFVLGLAKNDDRFVIIKPTKNVKQVLETYGYPFKSKEHAKKVDQYWRSKKITHYLEMYLDPNDNGRFKTKYKCPKQLLYQFTPENKLHISHLCCDKLKKEPVAKWKKQSGRTITLTGMRGAEGGQRANIKGCVLTDNKGNIVKFHPLLVVSDEWEEWFIKHYNDTHTHTHTLALAPLYCQPYNFKRTGCKGCPFSLDLQEQLEVMELYMPNERKQCEYIWKPVYDEYRRLNYRLKRVEKVKLF